MKNSGRIAAGAWLFVLVMVSAFMLHASAAAANSLRWTGAGASPHWIDPINWDKQVAAQPGDDLTFLPSSHWPMASNQFPAQTPFSSIAFQGDTGYAIVGNLFRVLGSITASHISGTSDIANDIEITGSGMLFSSANKGALLKFSGKKIDTLAPIELTISGDGDIEIDSQINRCAGCTMPFVKAGGGTLTLKGPSADNIPLTIFSGTVLANFSSVTVPSDILMKGGVLGGTSTVRNITAGAGMVKPGVGGEGTLKAEGNVILDSGATLDVSIGENAFSQLFVSGNIELRNPALRVTLVNGYAPPIGYRYGVLWNSGSNPINGTFKGIPEGSVIRAGDTYFSVTYKGGEGSEKSAELEAVEAPKEPVQQVMPAPTPQAESAQPPAAAPAATPRSDTPMEAGGSADASVGSGGCSLIVR